MINYTFYCCYKKNACVGMGGYTIVYILLLIRQGQAVIYTKYCCSGDVPHLQVLRTGKVTILVVVLETQKIVCSRKKAFSCLY